MHKCDPSCEKGAYGFNQKQWIFFTVTVREFEFPRREFQIPRLIHSIFHSWHETNQITPWIFLTRKLSVKIKSQHFHAVKNIVEGE